MKNCPQCHRIEIDDTLRFCRLDGTQLLPLESESITAVFDSPETRPTTKASGRARRANKSINSIAVLPFENAGDDANAEYLSDGMTEIIINNLSQLPKLKVMARSTVFRYKGQQVDPEEVGRQLGVRTIATGRVQQVGDRLTIGVELVDTVDGSLLWGERYLRKMDDIFALQEEIADQITHNLRLKLSQSQKKRLAKLHTRNRKAYELYLKARYFRNKRTQEDAIRGIDYFQQALALDANFALAYAGMADCQTMLGDVGIQALPPKEAFLQGRNSATRALELDDALPEAHGTMGHISMHLFEWTKAEKEFRRALELNPNDAQTSLWYAYYQAFNGRIKEALTTVNCVLQLDPLSAPVIRSAAELLYFDGRFDESVERFHQVIEMDSHYLAHLELARVYEHRGMYEAAFAEFAKARQLSHDNPGSLASVAHCHAIAGQPVIAQSLLRDLTRLSETQYISSYDLALIHKALDQDERCYQALNRACELHDGWMIYITVDPRWRSVSDDPRFAAIVKRVGLMGDGSI